VAEQTPPVQTPDPYDLGNTELDMRQPDGLPVEQPRDPATGQFISRVPEPSSEPAKPTHPAGLAALALDLGFEQDDIDNMTTDSLARSIRRVRSQMERTAQQFAHARDMDRAAVKQLPPEQPEVFDVGLNPEEYDPKLIAALQQIHGTSAKRIKDLEARLAASEQRSTQTRLQSARDAIDAGFAKMGPKYEKFVGKGSVSSLGKDSAEIKRRLAVINASGIAPDLSNVNPATIGDILKATADSLFMVEPDSAYVPTTPPPNGTVKGPSPTEWATQTMPPTQRRGSDLPPGAERATRNLERKQAEAGQQTGPDSDILETLL
jgi:hypothetical protein